MTRDEKLTKLRQARYRLESVAAVTDGDARRAVDSAIARVRLAIFLETQPTFPLVVAPRAQNAPARPHDS